MSKIHITLVGGQPTPVYQGIVYSNPDIVYLICSKMSVEQAENIKKELTRSKYNKCEYKLYQINDSDVSAMKSDIGKLYSSLLQEKDVSLNLSGGMKVWSVLFFQIFIHRDLSDIYCIGQNCELFDIKNARTDKVPFDMDTQFRLLGQVIKSYTSLEEYDDDDDMVLKDVRKIIHTNKYKGFKQLTSGFYSKYCNNDPTYSSILKKQLSYEIGTDYILWMPDNNTFKLNIGQEEYVFSSKNVAHLILNTGWFEYYVASKLGKTYGKNNIRMNVKFANMNYGDKNEVDIIVKVQTKLIFVECKTQVKNSTDVDKFNSVVRNYGGLGSKAFFVTYEKMKSEALEKCNDYHIKAYSIYQPNISPIERKRIWKGILKDVENNWNV